jgi:hypothetical protein
MKPLRLRLSILASFLSALAFGQGKDVPALKPRLATLAQQKMCDDQAKKKFHVDFPHPNQMTNYTSHYDAKMNVCYVMVHHVDTATAGPSVSDTVYDAFEGRLYASYIWVNPNGKKYWEVAPSECWVKPIGVQKQTCKDSEEFDEMVEKNFGIAK